MADIKGVQIKAAVMFLKERYGEQAYNGALAKLAPEFKALLPPIILDSNWYPFDLWRAIRRLSVLLIQPTDKGFDFPFEMGKYMANYAFTGVYKAFLEKTPEKQAKKFKFIQDFFSRGSRNVEATMLSESSCSVTYHYEENAPPTRSSCPNAMGFWVRTLELSGAMNVKSTHRKCALEGHPSCEFLFEWK